MHTTTRLSASQARYRADRLIQSILAQGESLNMNANNEEFTFDRRGAEAFAKKETSGLLRLAKYVAVLGATGAAIYYLNPTAVASLAQATKCAYSKLPTGSDARRKLAAAWSKVQGKLLGTVNVLDTTAGGITAAAPGGVTNARAPLFGRVTRRPRSVVKWYEETGVQNAVGRATSRAARGARVAAGAGLLVTDGISRAAVLDHQARMAIHGTAAVAAAAVTLLPRSAEAKHAAKAYASKGYTAKNKKARFNAYHEIGEYLDTKYEFKNAKDRDFFIRKVLNQPPK